MLTLKKIKTVKGEIRVPSDKSISHRAILISSIAEGKSVIKNWLVSEDTKATLNAVLQLGVQAHIRGNEVIVEGRNYLFSEPS
ncbi:MAG: 3-phosphoshikimate 1-carboxyvinyltransferase, partial [Hydrogenobacter sp.]